jgi:hypothetical protein
VRIDKKKIKHGWKVISAHRRTSFWIDGWGTRCYPKDEWVKPKFRCGPLAVFTNKDDAIHFCNIQFTHLKIVPCEYIPSRAKALYVPMWRAKKRAKKPLARCPIGTAFARAVKCLD